MWLDYGISGEIQSTFRQCAGLRQESEVSIMRPTYEAPAQKVSANQA